MPKIFLGFILLVLTGYCLTKRVDNICSTRHLKRVFLRLGESGGLTAHNISHDIPGNVSLQEGCQLEIVTCPSCIISLTFRLMNLNCCCESRFNLFFYNPCRCDYVLVTEPPYGSASGVSFCNAFPGSGEHRGGFNYKSKTRILRISLFYSRAYVQAFTADYKSEPNRQVFFGTSQYSPELNFSTGFFSSPFFPAAYPRDLTVEYMLTCIRQTNFSFEEVANPAEDDKSCRVHLLFTDFQLASSSFMEIYEGSRRVSVMSGISFRPPVIISATNSLSIRFYASGRSNTGFKAVFSFLSKNVAEKIAKPNTDCGGYVDDFGGTITMMKMVPSHTKLFDCIWLIKPLKNFFSVKSHLYLKVTTFLDFAGDAELEVRQGLTSESPLVEKLRHPVSQTFREHIIPLKSGYYVSLRASFGPKSHFAVTYASFSQNQCLILSEFLCKNFRCISKKLTCDGFDHCGDNSDESEVCFQEWGLEPGIGRWHTQMSNYFFPKIKHYSYLKTASVIFLMCVLGLIFLISVLASVLYWVIAKTRQGRDLQDQMQSVGDLRDCVSDEVSIEDILIDDPPSYEPPPNYEEVVKISSRLATCDSQQSSNKQWFQKVSTRDQALVHGFTQLDSGGDLHSGLVGSAQKVPFVKGVLVCRVPSPPLEESLDSLGCLLEDFSTFSPGCIFKYEVAYKENGRCRGDSGDVGNFSSDLKPSHSLSK